MLLIIKAIFTNKYARIAGLILILATASLWMLNHYTNGKVQDALIEYKDEAVVLFNSFVEEDIADVKKIDGVNSNLSDSQLDAGLCGGKPCATSELPQRMEADNSTSTGLSSYPEIIPQAEIANQEQQRQPESIHGKMQGCTMTSLSILPELFEGCEYKCSYDDYGNSEWIEFCE